MVCGDIKLIICLFCFVLCFGAEMIWYGRFLYGLLGEERGKRRCGDEERNRIRPAGIKDKRDA